MGYIENQIKQINKDIKEIKEKLKDCEPGDEDYYKDLLESLEIRKSDLLG